MEKMAQKTRPRITLRGVTSGTPSMGTRGM